MNNFIRISVLAIGLASSALAAPLDKFRVALPQADRTPGAETEIEVYFWYGCTYCHALEKDIEAWSQSKSNIEVFYVPAALDKSWESHAKAYYVAKEFDLLHRTHEQAYRMVRGDTSSLSNSAEVTTFLARGGVQQAELQQMYDSSELQDQLALDLSRVSAYEIVGTPVVVVDGTYRIYPGVGGPEEFLEKLSAILDRAASE